eukprot:6199809-Prymnesium_polylepis.1
MAPTPSVGSVRGGRGPPALLRCQLAPVQRRGGLVACGGRRPVCAHIPVHRLELLAQVLVEGQDWRLRHVELLLRHGRLDD